MRATLFALAFTSSLALGCAGELAYDPAEFAAALGDGGVTAQPGSGGNTPAPGAVACDAPAVLAASCAGRFCHAAEASAADLDLVSPGVEGRLVGVGSSCGGIPLIDPGNPAGSYVLQKLTAIDPACGVPMPLGGELPPDSVRCLEQWVYAVAAGGAP